MRLENQLPRLPGSAFKVSMVGGWSLVGSTYQVTANFTKTQIGFKSLFMLKYVVALCSFHNKQILENALSAYLTLAIECKCYLFYGWMLLT